MRKRRSLGSCNRAEATDQHVALNDLTEFPGNPPGHGGRIVAIINPVSRIERDVVEAELRRQAPHGTEIVLHHTDLARPLSEIIATDLKRASVVVAVGGDGTVSDVATAIAGHEIPLAIIPGGSTNMIAKVNGVPRDLRRAVSLIVGDHCVERIDVGRCNGKSLLHIGGSGLDARIFERARQPLKRRIGWLAYGPPAFSSLKEPSSRFSIAVDGQAFEVWSKLVLVANSASLISARFPLAPGVSPHDGLFDVLIFTADDRMAMARSAIDLLTFGRRKSPYVIHIQGQDIAIDADPPMPYELDGDVAGMTPFRVVVEPSALSIICACRT